MAGPEIFRLLWVTLFLALPGLLGCDSTTTQVQGVLVASPSGDLGLAVAADRAFADSYPVAVPKGCGFHIRTPSMNGITQYGPLNAQKTTGFPGGGPIQYS